jgi:hypothetical protein
MSVYPVIVLLAVVGQGPATSPPASTGVAECDRYVAMVRACLPKMCEEERILRELELDFALETIAAAIKHKGARHAGGTCSADIAAEAGDDLYGCHAESRASSILVEAAPGETSVTLRLSGAGLAGAGPLELALTAPLVPEPAGVYRITPTNGAYVLDTASAVSAPAGRVLLERDTPYCYSIATPADGAAGRHTVIRKGTFTTK